MKIATVVLVVALVACGPAGANNPFYHRLTPKIIHVEPSCDKIRRGCEGRHPDNVKGCQMLFEAAQASGYWGRDEDRARAHISGDVAPCTAF